jgi:hypothetical protein
MVLGMRALALAALLTCVAACGSNTEASGTVIDTCTPMGVINGKACAAGASCTFAGGCPRCACSDAGWQCPITPCPLN